MRSDVLGLRFILVAVAVGCASVAGCSADDSNSATTTGGNAGRGGSAGKGGAAGSSVTGSAGKGGSVGVGGSGGVGGAAGSVAAGGASGAAGGSGAGGSSGAGGMAGSGGADDGGTAGGGGSAGSGGTDAGGSAGSAGASGSAGADAGPDATVDSQPDVSIDAGTPDTSVPADGGTETSTNADAGRDADATTSTDGGSNESAVDTGARDGASAEAADAGCTGSIPSSPDAGGNAANVAQGGLVIMGSSCGNVSDAELPPHAFDNSVQSKWLCFLQASTTFALPTVAYRFAGGSTYAVNAYTVTSANDSPERDPSGWQLEGSSDDGATWATLDTRTGQTFASRFQTNSYVIPNCAAYGRYRLIVTSIAGVPATAMIFQVAEIQLFGPLGHGPTETANRAIGAAVTTTSTCGGTNPNETPAHAFDNDLSSKWFCGGNTAPSVDIALVTPRAITAYSVTAGNDSPDRDPKSWMLQGSNDADAGADSGTWVTLDTQTNQAFTNRFQTLSYSFTNATTYSHYRFVVTANNGSIDFQVGEIMLFGN